MVQRSPMAQRVASQEFHGAEAPRRGLADTLPPRPRSGPARPTDRPDAPPDLQTRLAAIAHNIRSLESKIVGGKIAGHHDAAGMAGPSAAVPAATPPDARAPDPLDVLRRRKLELEAAASTAAPPPPAPPLVPPSSMVADEAVVHERAVHGVFEPAPQAVGQPVGEEGDGLDLLAQHLDAQFARLAEALDDVRQLAETNAVGQARLTGETLPSMRQQLQALETRLAERAKTGAALDEPALAGLSAQIQAVQDTVAAMPTPDAIHSLEAGYRHILARLDDLKAGGRADDKIDALYGEVTSLREAMDGLSDTGTAALVSDMRGIIARLEASPRTDAAELTAALETVKAMAVHGAGQDVGDAIGAVVERLVALEARIEALADANPATSPGVESRLEALQEEIRRLGAFQGEARGLTEALDAIRDEVRGMPSTSALSGLDERFGALDRLEEMTGGYAAQIAALSGRLERLDGTLASQSDTVRELSALSRHVETFTATMPVREIEQSLLDLTGRVTALQEDRSAERLADAVRDLGERVESCLKSVPRTETLVAAVEAQIDGRLSAALAPLSDGLDRVNSRLNGLEQAIGADDVPLIEQVSTRLEVLVASMPTSNADGAIAQLEDQLARLLDEASAGGSITADDVLRLREELARARASVELGGNRDLQHSIVDQVRHLADRFDVVRQSGDATLLPEIERKIEALAERVQSLGLFVAPDPSAVSDAVLDRIEARFEDTQDALKPSVDRLQDELADLRQSAGEQDARLHATLEAVQDALATVLDRMGPSEADEHRQDGRRQDEPKQESTSLPAAKQSGETPLDPVGHKPVGHEQVGHEPSRAIQSDRVTPDQVAPDHDQQSHTQQNHAAPGDAQTLLNQLSSALHARARQSAASAAPVQDRTREEQAGDAVPAARDDERQTAPSDAAAQRASFIAAARRAAQNAALEAGGGVGDLGQARPDERSVEPGFADTDARGGAPAFDPSVPISAPVSGASSQERVGKKGDRPDDRAGGKPLLSGTMRLALLAFIVVILGLYAASSFLSGDPAPSTAPEPLAESAAEPVIEPSVPEPFPAEPSATGLPVSDPPVSDAPGAGDGASIDPGVPNALIAAPTDIDSALSSGFSRERGPVMAATPGVEQEQPAPESASPAANQAPRPSTLAIDTSAPTAEPAAPTGEIAEEATVRAGPPPANDLGPLLDPVLPPLPQGTADALPDAIGSPRLRLAAADGDPAAQFEVATRFMEGRFVQQNLQSAAYWYAQAADQGLVPAAYRLGSFYEQGRGVDRSVDAAIGWYERAALEGNPRAMHNLAVMAAEGRAGAPDFVRAAAWFLPAANRGLADSQFNLAVLYARGMGIERDLMESYKWFALSASAGDGEAASRRDEVAGVLGEQALALARARVDTWEPIPVQRSAVEVRQPEGGWDDTSVQAGADATAGPTQIAGVQIAGAQIAEVQRLLAERGYDPGPADGLIGPRTTEAVRAFRQSLGLGSGGAIDGALLDALRNGTSL